MGCNCCKFFKKKLSKEKVDENIIKQYSWDNRGLVEMDNYMVKNIDNESIVRHPGTIGGQQFIIQNCKNCKIYIMDYTAAVSIDDCLNCFIFLGPIKTSLFIRDSNDCRLVAACQQFRSRDCKRIDIYLHCTTLPIIEASTNMKFSCYQCYYPELPDQFMNSNLNVFNNNWDAVHDFTPVPGEKNYSFLPFESTYSTDIPEVGTASVISTDPLLSIVPLTYGSRSKIYEEVCFVVFFIETHQKEKVSTFLRFVLNDTCCLIRTKEIHLSNFEAEKLFGKSIFSALAIKGPLISLELSGLEVCDRCFENVNNTNEWMKANNVEMQDIFVSSLYETAKILSVFYSLTQRQTSV